MEVKDATFKGMGLALGFKEFEKMVVIKTEHGFLFGDSEGNIYDLDGKAIVEDYTLNEGALRGFKGEL